MQSSKSNNHLHRLVSHRLDKMREMQSCKLKRACQPVMKWNRLQQTLAEQARQQQQQQQQQQQKGR
ncbi:hypothetical protein T4E_4365 [Trichinella pseudospiralis]|uniref:Uncharacterized protein n=1 Tax=Trichinella pseudospiralis TaxID=6337 RepID=A0A0V0XHS6_TRIPS|nr:hypothetical protein T4E_4365 [Trichinella pseudospiralis]